MIAPAHDAVIVLEDIWKRYPPEREPKAVLRALSRLGGVELDGGQLMEDDEEYEEDAEQRPTRSEDAWLEALRGVSLSVEPGMCLGIVGPGGSGKSVLLRLIAGLTPPSAGRVVVCGTVAPALSSIARLVPSRVGIRKTLLALAMMTRLSRREVKRRLPEIFAFAGLPANSAPGTTPTRQQMERVLLAMMLSVDADIVLVDVPLADASRARFVERIRERSRAGAAVVVAAQSEDEIADFVDRFVYLEEGRVVYFEKGRIAVGDGGDTEIVAPSAEMPQRVDEVYPALPTRDLPMSPDARRYLDYIRILVGDRRADKAYRFAIARAPADAARLEWTAIAQCAGLDWVQQVPVVERLRQLHGVTDNEPIFGPGARRRDLPLSPDATRYLDYIRILTGEERAEQACRNTMTYAPEHAARVEWSWIARWAGFDWFEHVLLVERLRRLHGVSDDEPIYGARDAREKLEQRKAEHRGGPPGVGPS